MAKKKVPPEDWVSPSKKTADCQVSWSKVVREWNRKVRQNKREKITAIILENMEKIHAGGEQEAYKRGYKDGVDFMVKLFSLIDKDFKIEEDEQKS